MIYIEMEFASKMLGSMTFASVLLPERSEHMNKSAYKHPVLWLLHGQYGSHRDWMRFSSLERYVDGLDLAVIMPNGGDSAYNDMAYGPSYKSFIAEELPAVCRDFYPISDKREDNYIAGLSMGGQGAVRIGLYAPDNYSAIACLSSGNDIDIAFDVPPEVRSKRNYANYGTKNTSELKNTSYDLHYLIERVAATGKPKPRIYMACGTDDFIYAYNYEMKERFEKNNYDLTYEEEKGDHNWDYWDKKIVSVIDWLELERHKQPPDVTEGGLG